MTKPTVLFVCVHNAGRSQLAAGLAEQQAAGTITVLSAGLEPDEKVGDAVLASLAEIGIDRSEQVPQLITAELVAQSTVVVALKLGLDLPQVDGVRYETWPLPDPAGWDIDGIRPLRDHLTGKIEALLAQLTADQSS